MSVVQCPVSKRSQSVSFECNVFNYVWTVDKVSELTKPDSKPLFSPTFAAEDIRAYRWNLELKYFRDTDADKTEYLSLFMHLGKQSWCSTRLQFSLGAANNEIKNKCTGITSVTTGNEFKPGLGGWGSAKFLRVSHLKDNPLPDDKLMVTCTATLLPFATTDTACPDSEMTASFRQMFTEKVYADVVLVADDGRRFSAHRNVLSARSSFFRAMFDSKMRESQEKLVKISGIRSEILVYIMYYLYTDEVTKDMIILARDLLVAADMYNINRLVTICETEVCRQLAVDNAIETLVVADRCSSTYLKEVALKFIGTNSSVVLDSEAFKMLTDLNLTKEITRAVAGGHSQLPEKRQRTT